MLQFVYLIIVQATRILKIKIDDSSKADDYLVVWLQAANWLSNIVFKTGELNSNRLAKDHYAQLREMGLSAQLACSLCRTVAATYRTAKANKRWRLAIFKKPTIPIIWKRDFNRTKKGITLWGELLTTIESRPLPEGGWKCSNLKRIGKQWYLLLTHEIKIPEIKTNGSTVGADLGLRRLVVATNSLNQKTFFYRGGALNHRRTCIRKARAAIQAVGSRSSRRLLKRMSRNEATVTGTLLHCASKALIRYAVDNDASTIVLEDLTNIRLNSIAKGKDFRSRVHRWPYANFRFKVSYKAAAVGIMVEIVDPRNTSRGCSECGYISESNRNGLKFHCKRCGYKDDADRQGSKNIRLKIIPIEHRSTGMGSNQSPESSESFEINSGVLALDGITGLGLDSRLNCVK